MTGRPELDHLVLAAPDLADAVRWFADRTGVEPAQGGSHLGLGTANYLVGLGIGSYLEIIGPDAAQPDPAGPRPFSVDELTAPRIITWAVRTSDIDAAVREARESGYDPGEPLAMSRRTADGDLLEWRLTPPWLADGEGLVPFVIDWGDCPHPTTRGLPQAALRDLRGMHPDPASLRSALAALGTELPIEVGEPVALNAVIDGAAGPVTL